MAGKLPLKMQVAVRDVWNSETAAVQVARRALGQLLGCAVHVDVEWQQLLSALDAVYTERDALVTATAGCVEVWCKVLADLLDSADTVGGDRQQWAEKLIERLSLSGRLRLVVEVETVATGHGRGSGSGTVWLAEPGTFVLYLPRKTAVTVPGGYSSIYREDLLSCFNGGGGGTPGAAGAAAAAAAAAATTDPSAAGSGVASGDGWADVAVDRTTGTAAVVEPAAGGDAGAAAGAPACPGKIEFLPSVASLPRPEDLFLRPPYHLVVADYGEKKVVVQGSHSPSLQLLGEYFKRWCRINHQDSRSPPAVEVHFNQSCWGAQPMYDRMELAATNNHFEFTPVLVLAFVEGVLGYDLVSTSQSIWTFRRAEAFKGPDGRQ